MAGKGVMQGDVVVKNPVVKMDVVCKRRQLIAVNRDSCWHKNGQGKVPPERQEELTLQ